MKADDEPTEKPEIDQKTGDDGATGAPDPKRPLPYFADLTERGLAKICEDKAVGKFIFIAPTRSWKVSNGIFLEDDEMNRIEFHIAEQIKNLDSLIAKVAPEDPDTRREIRKRINGLDRYRVMRDIKLRLQTIPRLARTGKSFNLANDKINALNGVVDLTKMSLLKPNPIAWTKACNFNFVPEHLVQVQFLKFLNEFCCGRDDLVQYLLRYLGYAITGETSEQCMMVFLGSGSNGKTVIFEIIGAVLGNFFGKVNKAILFGKPDSATYAMTDLEGLRIALVAETSKEDVWEDGRLKQVVGERDFSARRMYENNRLYKNNAKIFVYLNSIPRSFANDRGFYRRIRVVPCEMVVTEAQRDIRLAQKIIENEGSAILRLLVEEASAWYREGLKPEPDCVRLALEEFQTENNRLKSFLKEMTINTGEISGTKLYEAYIEWAKERNEPIFKRTTFYRELEQRGCTKVRDPNKETIAFFGLSLKK